MTSPLESLRAALDSAWSAAIAAEAEGHDVAMTKLGLQDMLKDTAELIRGADYNSPEAVADRECERRHEAGLWTIGDMIARLEWLRSAAPAPIYTDQPKDCPGTGGSVSPIPSNLTPTT